GLPGLLVAAGVIPSRWGPFPSAAIQLLVGLPVLVAGWVALGRNFTPARLWLWAFGLAAVLFGFGRTLAPNYVTVAVLLLTLSWVQVRPPSVESSTGPPATPA
ncbi:MAG TPA: hypothetical protein VF134_00850, partial [Candidatus Dormibacteraeota bacterium]